MSRIRGLLRRTTVFGILFLTVTVIMALVRSSTPIGVGAFQLSMVSSSTPRGRTFAVPSSKTQTPSPLRDPFSAAAAALTAGKAGGFDITSNLISQLAVIALKLRLADQKQVSCDVTSKSPTDLLVKGLVGPVTVKGRGWRSSLGLTCRAIEATVDTCELDVGRILSHRKLRLKSPADGRAMIAFNAVDFGNFITHPLMRPPTIQAPAAEASPIQFQKKGTRIDPDTGVVTFYANYRGVEWRCSLKRGSSKTPQGHNAVVEVKPMTETQADGLHDSVDLLTESLTQFFNQMVFELDGVHLSFRDMMVTGQGRAPSVMLSLNIRVHKFPSARAAF